MNKKLLEGLKQVKTPKKNPPYWIGPTYISAKGIRMETVSSTVNNLRIVSDQSEEMVRTLNMDITNPKFQQTQSSFVIDTKINATKAENTSLNSPNSPISPNRSRQPS